MIFELLHEMHMNITKGFCYTKIIVTSCGK